MANEREGLRGVERRVPGGQVDVECREPLACAADLPREHPAADPPAAEPGVHGDEVARRLAARGSLTRIIMLTAATTLTDRVNGLELGADAYLAKPFEYPELVARVRALGRRSVAPVAPVLERASSVPALTAMRMRRLSPPTTT
ncbi:response regulator, partial [Bacillus sp. S34]|nr:response regulator [Bacillus sp. S34]